MAVAATVAAPMSIRSWRGSSEIAAHSSGEGTDRELQAGFPAPTGRVPSPLTLSKLIREPGTAPVPVGLRTGFRTWCGNNVEAVWSVAEPQYLDLMGGDSDAHEGSAAPAPDHPAASAR